MTIASRCTLSAIVLVLARIRVSAYPDRETQFAPSDAEFGAHIAGDHSYLEFKCTNFDCPRGYGGLPGLEAQGLPCKGRKRWQVMQRMCEPKVCEQDLSSLDPYIEHGPMFEDQLNPQKCANTWDVADVSHRRYQGGKCRGPEGSQWRRRNRSVEPERDLWQCRKTNTNPIGKNHVTDDVWYASKDWSCNPGTYDLIKNPFPKECCCAQTVLRAFQVYGIVTRCAKCCTKWYYEQHDDWPRFWTDKGPKGYPGGRTHFHQNACSCEFRKMPCGGGDFSQAPGKDWTADCKVAPGYTWADITVDGWPATGKHTINECKDFCRDSNDCVGCAYEAACSTEEDTLCYVWAVKTVDKFLPCQMDDYDAKRCNPRFGVLMGDGDPLCPDVKSDPGGWPNCWDLTNNC